MITLAAHYPLIPGFVLVNDDGRDVLVRDDHSYPGVASTFGWDIGDVIGAPGHSSCYHDGTDGTIDCQSCGRTATEFIASARDYLDDNVGATAEDPGYFEEVRCECGHFAAEHTADGGCAGCDAGGQDLVTILHPFGADDQW